MPGILAWAVEGCLQWQRCGLGEPDVVARETGGYRREQDVLADFVEDCCVLASVASISKAVATGLWINGREGLIDQPALLCRLGTATCRSASAGRPAVARIRVAAVFAGVGGHRRR